MTASQSPRDHLRLRIAAARRRSAAGRQLKRDARVLRRQAKTTALVAWSALAEAGVRGLGRLTDRGGSPR
ncbi:hypothetical protein Asp14428_14110 [Actinoplanes sp. NBRC 14428]|nr:hypothetical protein Asp14428_14110 [Actinoplanes sp. NBRC 14428]